VSDTRICEHCGDAFLPRREHARFCSAGCRVAWNQEHTADPAADLSALDWSITAMREATERLFRVRAWDRARAYGVVSEAVWWVTIVDATLVRYYPDSYDSVLDDLPAEQRLLAEDTLAGLRFVRNQMGNADYLDFVSPGAGAAGPDDGGICTWTWNPVPLPVLAPLPPRGQAWEMTRFRAYEARLAGHTIGETFSQAVSFLEQAVARAALDTGDPARTAGLSRVR
jgi:hypothetical protein